MENQTTCEGQDAQLTQCREIVNNGGRTVHQLILTLLFLMRALHVVTFAWCLKLWTDTEIADFPSVYPSSYDFDDIIRRRLPKGNKNENWHELWLP